MTISGADGARFLPVNLSGCRMVITAAAAGIGHAIAEAFIARGAKVALCDIDGDAVSRAAKTLPEAIRDVVDVSSAEATSRWITTVERKLGGIDVLINNAGIAGPTANVEDVTPAALDETLAVNVASQFAATRAAVPGMKARRSGVILNLSSIAGRLAFAMRSPYAASKWAVVGFTKSLAAELGEYDIRVNAILPGHVRTDRFDRVVAAKAAAKGVEVEAMRREYLDVVSLKRNVEKDDIANMALFLASPFGRNITGQAISVCGDVHMMR